MKIKNLYLYRLRNFAHFQFHAEFRNLVTKFTPDALKIAPLWEAYLPLYDREDSALKKISKSAVTLKIREADAARNEAFSAMADTQSASRKHFDPVRREAARRLQPVFDAYGNVAKEPLNEKTSAIYNLTQDLLGGKYADDSRDADIFELARELERRNSALDELVRRRYDEAGKRCDVTMKPARDAVDAAYKAIVARINALAEVEGAAAYEEFMLTLNAVIDKYSAMRRRRGAGGPAEADGAAAADREEAGEAA